MRFCFELQIAFFRVGAIVVYQRALNIDRMRVMPLDQVAVIAIHRPDQIGKGREDALGPAAAEAC